MLLRGCSSKRVCSSGGLFLGFGGGFLAGGLAFGGCGSGFRFFDAGQQAVDHDAAAIFAYHDALVHFDFKLPLRRDTVEALSLIHI